MSSLPVWFIDANGTQGSAVPVWIQKKGAAEPRQYLLTAQHIVREGDPRTGPYSTSIHAWREDTGYNPAAGIHVTVDLDLSPDPAQPLVIADDFAFLALPPGDSAFSAPPLVPFAQSAPPLIDLTLAGYISGNELIQVHKGIVRPATFPGWTYDSLLSASASGVLTPGSGKPAGGVSGGGVFLDGRYLGLYRGEFENIGPHIFIPVSRFREWCAARGHELLDLSIEGKVAIVAKAIAKLRPLKDNPLVQLWVDVSKREVQDLKHKLAGVHLNMRLRDYLHRMQRQYLYANKAASATEFDDIAIDTFTIAIAGIKEEVIGASDTLDNLAPGARKPSWLVVLIDAITLADTSQAAQEIAQKDAQKVCRKIGTVLRTSLPHISQDLVTGAEEMDLDRLGNLLGNISMLPGVAPSTSEAFLAGQKAFSDTNAEFKALTALQYKWQRIDVSLWDAERAVQTWEPGGRDEFATHWNDILEDLPPLLSQAGDDAWASSLRSTADTVGELIHRDAPQRALASSYERFAITTRKQIARVSHDSLEFVQKLAPLFESLASLSQLAVASAPQATKYIIAYCMDKADVELATQLMAPSGPDKENRTPLEVTSSMVVGDASEDEIRQLLDAGLHIEYLPDPPATPVAPIASQLQYFTAEERRTPRTFILHLKGPLLPERREQLAKHGVVIREALPADHYLVKFTPVDAEQVESLPFVLEVTARRAQTQEQLNFFGLSRDARRPTPPEARLRSLDAAMIEVEDEGLESLGSGPSESRPHDILLEPGRDTPAFVKTLQEEGIEVSGHERQKIRVLLVPESEQAAWVARLPGVFGMEEYIEPELGNLHARTSMGFPTTNNTASPLPWNGRDEIIAVADSGLDDQHPDFAGRIVERVALGRPGDTSDPHGHGTHVCGSALGDGSASTDRALAGTAPGAKLYLQSILGPTDGGTRFPLSGLPISLFNLFDPAYQFGARIHNNSWGALAGSYYRLHSLEVDDYVSEHRDMLVVIAAGNRGTSNDPAEDERRSARGHVEWNSLSTPATSKNGLTVGASRSSIKSGGWSQRTHERAFPEKFKVLNPAEKPDIATELVSGDDEEIAGFSGRGLGAHLQIKPDVVAPGTDIVSARSSRAPDQHYSGPCQGNDKYAHMCGTSMATPLVSGCAAVVRQYYKDVHAWSQPSAALVKATLINGTRELRGVHATAAPIGFPNPHQGFGRIHMPTTLPTEAGPFALHYHDNWLAPAAHVSMKQPRSFQFRVTENGGPDDWLRLCLAYTDAPGSGIQNVLVLQLRSTASNKRYSGNPDMLKELRQTLGQLDRNNNVSIIRISAPPAGEYTVQVSARNIVSGGNQDFALVVTGRHVEGFAPLD